jgi:hypothetical protein
VVAVTLRELGQFLGELEEKLEPRAQLERLEIIADLGELGGQCGTHGSTTTVRPAASVKLAARVTPAVVKPAVVKPAVV